MNRRGHIGTGLMPLIALALFVNAWVVMYGFDVDLTKSRADLRAIEEKSSFTHKFVKDELNKTFLEAIAQSDKSNFELSFNNSLRQSANNLRNSGLNTNLYARIALGEYTLTKNGENYTLIVKDVFENEASGVNEISYFYSLRINFDKTKVVSIEEF
jgi:hypothetical protein